MTETFEQLEAKVIDWAKARKIIPNSTALAQLEGKGLEELQEAIDAAREDDQDGFIDGVGDTVVVLVIAAYLRGTSIVPCLSAAWGEIRDRRGTLGPDGIFVKCPTCELPGSMKPSHDGSRNCKSGSIASGGTKPHCTCDVCF